MNSERRVLILTDVHIVYKLCWHIDPSATPIQRRQVMILQPGEPEPNPEDTHQLVFQAQTEGLCTNCAEKILGARKELFDAQRDVWAARLEIESEEAFQAFFAVEKELLTQFLMTSRKAVLERLDMYHTEPLAAHVRRVRQLLLCANEMQREVSTHRGPNARVVERAIHVLGREFIMVDVWRLKSDSDLRDGLEIAVPAIMNIVLDMRPNADLDSDIQATMAAEFGKANL